MQTCTWHGIYRFFLHKYLFSLLSCTELLLVSGCRLIVYDDEEGVSGERRLLATVPDVSEDGTG